MPIGADHGQQGDHPILSQLLALLQHPHINDAIARGIEQLNAGLHGFTATDRVWSELNHITIVNDEDVVGGHTHRLRRFAVADEHAVLAMHRHEKLGSGECQHQLLILLATVARHMNALTLAVDNLGAEHHQAIDRIDH